MEISGHGPLKSKFTAKVFGSNNLWARLFEKIIETVSHCWQMEFWQSLRSSPCCARIYTQNRPIGGRGCQKNKPIGRRGYKN